MAQTNGGFSGTRRMLDAVELLEADHRCIDQLLRKFEKLKDPLDKAELAGRICSAIVVHTTLEEELFYSTFLLATGDVEIHRQAEVEHDACITLLARVEAADFTDGRLNARVQILAQVFRHHIHEEERRDGMFAIARSAGIDLETLGRQMKKRKLLLQNGRSSPRWATAPR